MWRTLKLRVRTEYNKCMLRSSIMHSWNYDRSNLISDTLIYQQHAVNERQTWKLYVSLQPSSLSRVCSCQQFDWMTVLHKTTGPQSLFTTTKLIDLRMTWTIDTYMIHVHNVSYHQYPLITNMYVMYACTYALVRTHTHAMLPVQTVQGTTEP